MGNNPQEELKDFILTELIEKDDLLSNILSRDGQKKLAESFSKTLTEANISLSSLDKNNNDTMDTLKLGCRAQAAQMLDPSLKIEMKLILDPLAKKEKSEEKDETKEANLEKNLFKMLKTMLTLKLSQENKAPTDEQKNELEMKLKDMAKSLSKGKSGPTMMKGCMDALVRESMERKSLYGGIDPELGSGQERTSVDSIQGGNQFARQDLSNTGETFMAIIDKPNSGQPNPVGSIISKDVNKLIDIAFAPPEQEKTAGSSPFHSPRDTPKNKPPGTI